MPLTRRIVTAAASARTCRVVRDVRRYDAAVTSRTELLDLLDRFAARAATQPLTLGEVADGLGGSSFSLLCIILSLPFLTPVSLGPLATVGGLTLAAIAWQMVRGDVAPSLPQRVRGIEMSPKIWHALLATCAKVVGFCARFSRPRYRRWVEGMAGARLRGVLIISAGLLMAVPLFGLPFNNALPALAIIVVCLAELEDDGLLLWAGIGLTAVSAVYILGVLIAVAIFGTEVVTRFFPAGLG